MRKMKILVHDYAGHPFQVQLSRELAKRGHDVLHLYAGYYITPRGSLESRRGDPKTLHIEGVYIKEPLQKYSFIKRWVQEREYGEKLVAKVGDFHPGVVISANTPLDAQLHLMNYCQLSGIRFVFWMQDVISLAIGNLLGSKYPLIGSLIGQFYKVIEKRILRRSDAVVVISPDFKSLLEKLGIPNDIVYVIPNWAPLDELPIKPRNNPWSIEHFSEEKFRFLYTGTLGMKHNPDLLLQLAIHLADTSPQSEIIIASEGEGAEWLSKQSDSQQLDNIKVIGFQPMNQYAEVLGSADVLVAILENEAGEFCVPSKVLSYLCAKRALLLAVPDSNYAARIIADYEAGLVVDPSNYSDFFSAADLLIQEPFTRKRFSYNAREYAEKTFNISKITDHFEQILSDT